MEPFVETSNRKEVDHGVRKIARKSLQTIAIKITGHKGRLKFVNPKFNDILRFEADCLFWLGDRLVHIEIQAQNDPKMQARMGMYAFMALFQEGQIAGSIRYLCRPKDPKDA